MSGDTSSNVFGKNGNVVLVRIQEIQDEYDRRIISSINGFIFYRFRTRSTVDTTTSEKNFWQRLFAKCESASSNEKTSLRSLVKTNEDYLISINLVVLVSICFMCRFYLFISGDNCIGHTWPYDSIFNGYIR